MFTVYDTIFQSACSVRKSRRVNQISFSLSSFARHVHFRQGQYQKSYLDLGFRYCICPTQPIFTNTETAMLSTLGLHLPHFSYFLSLSSSFYPLSPSSSFSLVHPSPPPPASTSPPLRLGTNLVAFPIR